MIWEGDRDMDYGHGKALGGRFPWKIVEMSLVQKLMPNKFTGRHTKRQKKLVFTQGNEQRK